MSLPQSSSKKRKINSNFNSDFNVDMKIKDSLTNVTLQEGATRIRVEAFSGCSSLKSMTVTEGVTTIGSKALYECSGITCVTLQTGVTTKVDIKIKDSDILALLNYNALDIPPYNLNKIPYTKDQIYNTIKKLCALILMHNNYFIPPPVKFFTLVKKVSEFYQNFYSQTIEVQKCKLKCIYIEYNLAKLKFKLYKSNITIAKEIHKFNKTLSFKQFSSEFIRLLTKTPVYIIKENDGLIDFNIVVRKCFKYYYHNCRDQFCGIFNDDELVKNYESYSSDHLLYQLFPEKINITKKTIFTMYENVADLPDCSGFE